MGTNRTLIFSIDDLAKFYKVSFKKMSAKQFHLFTKMFFAFVQSYLSMDEESIVVDEKKKIFSGKATKLEPKDSPFVPIWRDAVSIWFCLCACYVDNIDGIVSGFMNKFKKTKLDLRSKVDLANSYDFWKTMLGIVKHHGFFNDNVWRYPHRRFAKCNESFFKGLGIDTSSDDEVIQAMHKISYFFVDG